MDTISGSKTPSQIVIGFSKLVTHVTPLGANPLPFVICDYDLITS